MHWYIKAFHELSVEELYNIMRLRMDVFIIEQNCIYQELDGADQRAYHLFLKKDEGQILAYSRLFLKGDYFTEASIGRVIVEKDSRSFGYAKQLLNQSIEFLEIEKNQTNIVIQAQLYLLSFYQSFGFEPISEPYMHDDIEHIDMKKTAEA
ncbi:GNAT family N-acetyltransferase [Alkalihalobacillus trypoxylicola]|uniref:GNAT family acetyltransferase n=1 Tax=Alkalihalobacillus trypoxylicola TaxID=519424 RepID=A0A162EDP8_9BACI|nr:GNAT family N-acetyltransferase [Alkalihalobacillus trypoxylicola]KYG32339.1 GNAT family acetyltransferase [Alkalihalobacillus trypoxylicola]